ncbi:hypothetical protein sos41_17250 [Alphaproteobacteria bacterium SO-S41]|nr:hypothetical protein sos41_17250 [Alphaproteobacteria bacterium SO-S41]
MPPFKFLAVLFLAFTTAGAATAASLRVAPVMIDLNPPQAASSLKVWNDGEEPINVQVRVFRWRQVNGEDVLEPTTDVVVSPPIARLMPGEENLVRVVRVSQTPIVGEESYRVLVDELPDPGARKSGAVKLVLRHSIPLFFAAEGSLAPSVVWKMQREAGGIRIVATNSGTKRLRVVNLALGVAGAEVARQEGLVGYVLGGASASWFIPVKSGTPAGAAVTISAESEAGRIHAIAEPTGG